MDDSASVFASFCGNSFGVIVKSSIRALVVGHAVLSDVCSFTPHQLGAQKIQETPATGRTVRLIAEGRLPEDPSLNSSICMALVRGMAAVVSCCLVQPHPPHATGIAIVVFSVVAVDASLNGLNVLLDWYSTVVASAGKCAADFASVVTGLAPATLTTKISSFGVVRGRFELPLGTARPPN